MDKAKLRAILIRDEHSYLLNTEEYFTDELKSAKILITGAGGSIGQRLLERLSKLGVNILPTDIEKVAHPNYQYLDVTDTTNVGRIIDEYQPTHIINLAGAKHAPEGEVDPYETLKINTMGTRNLIFFAKGNSHIVLSSTCKSCDPETAYGASKLIAERMVLNAGGSIARYYNVVETQGNVFELWNHQSIKKVALCDRYFISLDEAVGLTIYAMFNDGRFCVSAKKTPMLDVFFACYPNHKYEVIPRRRGDRKAEPSKAGSEEFERVNSSIHKIISYHDASNN